MNLYELTSSRLALQSKLQDMNFDEQTIQDTLEGESTELQAKIEDYGFVIRNMEAFSDAIKAEEKRLSDRRKAQEAKVERIKAWLLENMQACNIQKIECPAFTIAVRTNPPKVVIDHEGDIPEQFMVTPEPPPAAPDKELIATAIKSGQDVAGCHLEQSQRIEIK